VGRKGEFGQGDGGVTPGMSGGGIRDSGGWATWYVLRYFFLSFQSQSFSSQQNARIRRRKGDESHMTPSKPQLISPRKPRSIHRPRSRHESHHRGPQRCPNLLSPTRSHRVHRSITYRNRHRPHSASSPYHLIPHFRNRALTHASRRFTHQRLSRRNRS